MKKDIFSFQSSDDLQSFSLFYSMDVIRFMGDSSACTGFLHSRAVRYDKSRVHGSSSRVFCSSLLGAAACYFDEIFQIKHFSRYKIYSWIMLWLVYDKIFWFSFHLASFCFAICWQFNQFVFLLQACALFGAAALDLVPTKKVKVVYLALIFSLVMTYIFQFFNTMTPRYKNGHARIVVKFQITGRLVYPRCLDHAFIPSSQSKRRTNSLFYQAHYRDCSYNWARRHFPNGSQISDRCRA